MIWKLYLCLENVRVDVLVIALTPFSSASCIVAFTVNVYEMKYYKIKVITLKGLNFSSSVF